MQSASAVTDVTTAVTCSYKAQLLQSREAGILDVVSRLLAEKGFDAMTVDEVAAQVGMAKASLYKHFPSKEDLAGAAMVRVLRRARNFLDGLSADLPPLQCLHAAVRWAMEHKLAGEMPSLPGQSSGLRASVMANAGCVDGLTDIGERLGAWIVAAQAQGTINPQLPAVVVRYTLYARACDPVLEFLKTDGRYSDAQIVDLVLKTCFEGLAAP